MAWSIEEFSGPILKKAEAANKKREKYPINPNISTKDSIKN